MAVFREEALIGGGAESRVVDEDVEPRVVPKDRFPELTDLCERSEVGGVEPGAARTTSLDFVDECHPSLTIAAVDNDVCTTRSDSASNLLPEAARRSCHENHLLACCGSGLSPGGRCEQQDAG